MDQPDEVADSVATSNYEKFQTGNPIVRRLIARFYRVVTGKVIALEPRSVLDAGCGEGETLERLAAVLPLSQAGIDLNEDSVTYATKRLPGAVISRGNILDSGFDTNSFDLVICLEVLEHLSDPGAALTELARIARQDLVVSVPYEPWFRLGSLARGKYLSDWGNHPEHVNHWNPKTLRSFLSRQVEVVSVTSSTPWIVAHCRPFD